MQLRGHKIPRKKAVPRAVICSPCGALFSTRANRVRRFGLGGRACHSFSLYSVRKASNSL